MRELRSGENTSPEAARRKNLWLPWTWILLSYRRPGTDARARIWPSVGARIAWYFYKHANQHDWFVWLVIQWDGGDICHCTSWGKFCLSIPPLQPFLGDVTQRSPSRNGCSNPNNIPFTKLANHRFRSIFKTVFAPKSPFETSPIRECFLSLYPVVGDVTNEHTDFRFLFMDAEKYRRRLNEFSM